MNRRWSGSGMRTRKKISFNSSGQFISRNIRCSTRSKMEVGHSQSPRFECLLPQTASRMLFRVSQVMVDSKIHYITLPLSRGRVTGRLESSDRRAPVNQEENGSNGRDAANPNVAQGSLLATWPMSLSTQALNKVTSGDDASRQFHCIAPYYC